MTVNLTRIYTKLGDSGETHLGDMSRVSKLHPRVEAYGTVDELNAAIGMALTQPDLPERIAGWLTRIQNDLLDLGADLSVPDPADDGGGSGEGGVGKADGADDGAGEREAGDRAGEREAGAGAGEREADDGEDPVNSAKQQAPRTRLRVTAQYTEWLEQACDEINATLPPLRSFVIPGGTPASAHLHVCRTVCRRAERRAIAVGEGNPEVVRYLNRLSDLLFILARAVNRDSRADGESLASEPLWDPGAHSGTAPRSGG